MSEIDWDLISKIAAPLKDYVTSFGILTGGVWALFRFRIWREQETALSIDLAYETVKYKHDDMLTFIDVHLHNKGKVQLRALAVEPAYDIDCADVSCAKHRYEYGLGLKIRRVPGNLKAVDFKADWFGNSGWREAEQEVNLLQGYVKCVDRKLQTDFWMEPGESYSLAASLVLTEGTYIALVTFIGSSGKIDEFWQRFFLIQVPRPHGSKIHVTCPKSD